MNERNRKKSLIAMIGKHGTPPPGNNGRTQKDCRCSSRKSGRASFTQHI